MIIYEILVLFLGLVIAVTFILMLRKLFFGSSTKIKIDKKVNSRELFEPAGTTELNIPLDDASHEAPTEDKKNYDEINDNLDNNLDFQGEKKNEILSIHLENSSDAKFTYKLLTEFLTSSNFEFSDEGGWFKIFTDVEDSFLLVNGLNPGKFIPEEEIIDSPIMTLIYSLQANSNSVSAFSQLINFAQLLAENFDSKILDGERNILTQQMVEHYSQIAEEFDLSNLT